MTSSSPAASPIPPPEVRIGPLLEPTSYRDTKDPCPVFDGRRWHVYGSGGSILVESWKLLHAVSPALSGPWVPLEPVGVDEISRDRMAAPGVVHDGKCFHMFVQTDFLGVGGTIEHLVSEDGARFERRDTALASVPDTQEAGLFDVNPAVLDGRLFLVYAAMAADLLGLRWDWDRHAATVRGPDVFLAESTSGTWDGPWERRGRVLAQEEVAFHVPPGAPDYEWGLEGPQILALPSGVVLLIGVCFVAGRRGTRQRVFLAAGASASGPFDVLDLMLEPGAAWWESGEVGHPTAVLDGDDLWVLYQGRSVEVAPDDDGEARWRYGAARWPVRAIEDAVARQVAADGSSRP